VDLRRWIVDEHAAARTRFEQSIAAVVPIERWTDPAGDGGSSIAFLAFHAAYHEDLAVNAVLGARPTVLSARRDDLGLGAFDPATGLAESEPRELTAALELDALTAYLRAVHDGATADLAVLDTATLDTDASGPAGLVRAGIDERAVPWLYRMWDAKSGGWFVQWEAIGHRVNHLGEMVSVRNRLGLSPF
jgi:DinB superfamily